MRRISSIEEMEGVSFDDSSNEDDSEVVEQSLMQLRQKIQTMTRTTSIYMYLSYSQAIC